MTRYEGTEVRCRGMTESVEPTGWEHRIEQVTITDSWETPRQLQKVELFRQRLDDLGEHGWELVDYSVSTHTVPVEASVTAAQTHMAVLKRPTGRPPVPESAAEASGRAEPGSAETWTSEETLKALVARWEEACGPVPNELEGLLAAQPFLPEDDWSLIVPCSPSGQATDDSRALLAVGQSWWLLVSFADDDGRVRVGDLSTLIDVMDREATLELTDVSEVVEKVIFPTARSAARTADFVRARRAALAAGS